VPLNVALYRSGASGGALAELDLQIFPLEHPDPEKNEETQRHP
jgi:hypothetical protein